MCYVYDDINRRIRQVQKVGDADCSAGGGDGDADDVWTKTAYDAVGNVTELTTAKNGGTPAVCNGAAPSADCETTRYFYDEANRLVREAYPLRQAGDPVKNTREFAYDRAGNLVQRTDQKNLNTFYVYNDLYYLTHRNYDTDPADSFAYDVGGRMIQALRDGWLVTFTYDAANRVLQTAQNGQAVSYAYDIPGRKRTLSYPGGKVVVEQRDLRERLDTLNAGAIAAYTYDLGNRVTTRVYGNGSRAAYSYNANDWITDLSHTKSDTSLIAGFGHDYDKEGNKRFQQNHLDAAPGDCDQAHFPADRAKCSESYQYDDLYRLVHYKLGELDVGGDVPVPLTQSQYALDKLGNWDGKTTTVDANPPVVENRQHNAVNEITQIDAVPIASDADGNLTQDDRYFYAYDQENRLTQAAQIAPSEVVGQYRYDALGRRVAKTLGASRGGTETRYVYDDARIIEEQNNGGATLAAYSYGNYIDEVLTMDRGGQTYYYHQNTLWSVEAITNSAQVVVERYAYDAYGRPTVTDGLGNVLANPWGAVHSAVGNPWMFTGRQYDEEAGLYYYRARYYDPDKGRFLQRDPKGYMDSMNIYEYVRDNPINASDPEGQLLLVFNRGFTGGRLQWRNEFALVGFTWQRALPNFQFRLPFVGQIKGIVWLQTVDVMWHCRKGAAPACRNSFTFNEWFGQAPNFLTLGFPGIASPVEFPPFWPLVRVYSFGRDIHANSYPEECECCTETRNMDAYEGIVFGVTPRPGLGREWGMLSAIPGQAVPANFNNPPVAVAQRTGLGLPLGQAKNWGLTVNCSPDCVRAAVWGVL